MKTICQCKHCGHKSAPQPSNVKCPVYCVSCRRKEQREIMDKENEELGLGSCEVCNKKVVELNN